MNVIIQVLIHALMISSFVFIMMLLIEYINIQTSGNWEEALKRNKWKQYLISGILGATPGCLGAFSVVALYSHNVVSFGALVTAMIATSGDEAFVMFSMFPLKAFWLTFIILAIGLIAGYLTDVVMKKQKVLSDNFDHELQIHDKETCNCFPKGEILNQLKTISFQRTLLIVLLMLLVFGFIFEIIGPQEWNWIKITFMVSTLFALFVVLTVPEHFLEEHLWGHILKKHLPRIFLWTFGALILIYFLTQYLDMETWIKSNYIIVLIVAVLIGIIPESDPHMIFVTLFAQGSIPFSILLASSIVQDGHGTLPLLAVSKRGFVILKIVNVFFGFIVGLAGLLFYI